MAKQVYNRVFTKEKWKEVNQYNKDVLEDFIQECRANGKSEGTVKQYYNDARILLIYVLETQKNKELNRLTKKSFRNYILWLKDNGLSPSRINRLLVVGRGLMNFGLDDDEYSDDFEDCKLNPSRVKGLRKESVREIIFLTDEEVECIYKTLKKKKLYSQALLCAFLYDSACRRNEAFQVMRDSISPKKGIIAKEVVGKRGKKFKLIYNSRTIEAYKNLEKNRKVDDNVLWLTQDNTPASYMTLYNWVISWQGILKDNMGVEKEFNAHSFRHSALENLSNGSHYVAKKLNKKFTLQELKLLANHDDIGVTEGYLRDDSEDKLMMAFGI